MINYKTHFVTVTQSRSIDKLSEKCCESIFINSSGIIRKVEPISIGVYTIYHTKINGKVAYEKTNGDMYIYQNEKNHWMVKYNRKNIRQFLYELKIYEIVYLQISDVIGHEQGFIANTECKTQICPESCSSSWKTFESQTSPWIIDTSFTIACGKK